MHVSHLYLEQNIKGRDFLIGDIHGCLNELKAMLAHVNFNDNDRLICTGDLVDRGPFNLETLDLFISQPNFYTVKGNHDLYLQCLLTNQFSYDIEHSIQAYTMPWMTRENKEKLESDMKYAFYLDKLPIVISVIDNKKTPLYHVVHSEFTSDECSLSEMSRYDYSATRSRWVNAIEAEKAVKITNDWVANLNFNHVSQEYDFLLKRDIFYHSEIKKQEQALTYSGHNALTYPCQLGRQVIIDLGLCFHYESSQIKANSKFIPSLCITEAHTPTCYVGSYIDTENGKQFIIEDSLIHDFSLTESVVPTLKT